MFEWPRRAPYNTRRFGLVTHWSGALDAPSPRALRDQRIDFKAFFLRSPRCTGRRPMTSQSARRRRPDALERRSLWLAAVMAGLAAVLAGLWPVPGEGPALVRSAAALLGSASILVPSGVFGWMAARGSAQQVTGLAALKVVGTLTLMVIAFALCADKALWVLVGVITAAIGQSIAIVMASRLESP